MIKKLMIIVWFGELPDWMHNWIANMEYLKPYGYDYKIFTNQKLFEQRVREKLGIEPFIISGTGKPWDYRPALGVLYEEELKGYDYWGVTDFDCVYGDVNKWMPDTNLAQYDIWSNHETYVAGIWSLFRNVPKVNNLFRECPNWKVRMSESQATGWIEMEYSEVVDEMHNKCKINKLYTHYQGHNPNITTNLTFKEGKLYDYGDEIMMFHFNRIKPKVFPLKEDI